MHGVQLTINITAQRQCPNPYHGTFPLTAEGCGAAHCAVQSCSTLSVRSLSLLITLCLPNSPVNSPSLVVTALLLLLFLATRTGNYLITAKY
jgi:hypothetical protein